MKKKIIADKNKRLSFMKQEKKKMLLKSISKNHYLKISDRGRSRIEMKAEVMRFNEINNYCVITGRGRGVLRDFKVSRMIFKELASFGYLNGVKKGSW